MGGPPGPAADADGQVLEYFSNLQAQAAEATGLQTKLLEQTRSGWQVVKLSISSLCGLSSAWLDMGLSKTVEYPKVVFF